MNSKQIINMEKSTIKKAFIKHFELDEIDLIIDLLEQVFKLDYKEDAEFWEEIIGRLKRKINPYSDHHTYKCKMEAHLVLQKYKLATQHIAQFFEDTNIKIAISWHSRRFVLKSTNVNLH